MPYKDKEAKRKYQRVWMANRRKNWLNDKSCIACGSIEQLEIDHVNPDEKWKHNFWSYSWKKIYSELEKCQVLCKPCHSSKTKVDLGAELPAEHGTHRAYNKKKCRCDVCKVFHNNYVHSRRIASQ